MDFDKLLLCLTELAKQFYDGYMTADEYKYHAGSAVQEYTDANFVYTGDIPVVA